MGSLAAERWKAQQRRKEAQIWAQGFVQGFVQGFMQGFMQVYERANELAKERANELGRVEALEYHRRTMCRHVTRRFNASTGERLSALLAGVSEQERLAAVDDAIIECGTGEEVLAAARRIVDEAD